MSGTTTTMKRVPILPLGRGMVHLGSMEWYRQREGIAQAFTEDSEGQQLQIGIDVIGKDDDIVVDVVDDDDKKNLHPKRKDQHKSVEFVKLVCVTITKFIPC